MSAYVVAQYRVTKPEPFQQYAPTVIPTIAAHGGEVLAADFEAQVIEGQPQPVTVVLRFASKEAARAWYESAEYQAIKHLRLDNTAAATVVIADEFVLPP
jgi:uncharacterized protein (DUF1330 family)